MVSFIGPLEVCTMVLLFIIGQAATRGEMYSLLTSQVSFA